MDLTTLLFLAGVWVVLSLLGRAKKQSQRGRTAAPGGPLEPTLGRPPVRRPDRTQTEGSRLEQWLRELETTLQNAESGPRGRHADRALEDAEDVEDRETLEIEPVVVSMPIPDRPERIVESRDADAEKLISRRIKEAELRNRALTLADHRAFDKKIRQQKPIKVLVKPTDKEHRDRLRQAVIWMEILGPPKGL